MTLRTTTLSPGEAYAKIREQGAGAITHLQRVKAQFVLPTTAADAVLALVQHCRAVILRIDAWTVPGLSEFAQAQRVDGTYNIGADLANARAAYVALRDTLMQRFPKDTNDWLSYQKFDVDGAITIRTFTAAQLSDAIPFIDAVIVALS